MRKLKVMTVVGTRPEIIRLSRVIQQLDRLCDHGLVASQLGDPTPERGGRAKKLFRVTPAGLSAIRRTQRAFVALWKGLPELKGAL